MQPSTKRPQKRKLTEKQKRLLRKKRRQERLRSIALVFCALAICAIAVIMVVRSAPKDEQTYSLEAVLAANATPTPVPTAVPTRAPLPTVAATAQPTPQAAAVMSQQVSATMQPDAAGAQELSERFAGIAAVNEAAQPESTQPAAVQPTAPVLAAESTLAPTPVPTATPVPVMRSVHFRVTGDIMATEGQQEYALKAGNGQAYNYYPQYTLIAPSLQAADYTMGNLETTIGKYGDMDYSGYPRFNTSETLLNTLKDCGYDFFTLANNHMLDRYFDGLKTTVSNVETMGFAHTGAYRSREERSTPKIVEIGGIRFGFLAYTTYANGMEKNCDEGATLYGVPFFSNADIEGDVKSLREAGAEVVIAFPHWGTEYQTSPDATQKKYAEKLAVAGVDIIIGSHPHVLQPMGFVDVTRSDGSAAKVFVAYSMGNFISTQSHSGYTDSGMILDFTVQEQPDGTFTLENVGYVPTFCWKHDNTLQVVPAVKYYQNRPSNMSSSSYKRLKNGLQATMKMMGEQFAVLES